MLCTGLPSVNFDYRVWANNMLYSACYKALNKWHRMRCRVSTCAAVLFLATGARAISAYGCIKAKYFLICQMKGKMKKALKVHLIQPITCTVIKTRLSFIIKLFFMVRKEASVSARGKKAAKTMHSHCIWRWCAL